jgi:hypothetical protein
VSDTAAFRSSTGTELPGSAKRAFETKFVGAGGRYVRLEVTFDARTLHRETVRVQR